MALETAQHADRVAETSTTTGGGPFTLAGAKSGAYQTFGTAGLTECDVLIIGVSGASLTASEWQTGRATISGSALTLEVAYDGSDGAGTAVSFSSGTKDIYCTVPARREETIWARYRLVTNDSIADSTTDDLLFDDASTEEENEGSGFTHSTSTNPERVTIAAKLDGMLVQVEAHSRWTANATGSRFTLIQHLSSAGASKNYAIQGAANAGSTYATDMTAVGTFKVATGDYFLFRVIQDSGGALALVGSLTYWTFRVVR